MKVSGILNYVDVNVNINIVVIQTADHATPNRRFRNTTKGMYLPIIKIWGEHMNFDEAIKVHTYWKVTLRWMINGHRAVDADEKSDAHRCELGNWIDQVGAEFGSLPEFQMLKHEHAEFHRVAGEVISKVQQGLVAEADVMLSTEGSFTAASARTIDAIRALKARVEAAAG